MRAIACGTTLAKRACWRRLPSAASRNRWKAWMPARHVSCSTASNASARPEAGAGLRALRVAGPGGSDGHPQSHAGFHRQGAGDSGASPLPCRSAFDPRHERGGGCPDALPQQRLDQHAAEVAGGNEPVDAGNPLPRGLPRLLLHVHVAAVHAHERGDPGADRAVRRRAWPASG